MALTVRFKLDANAVSVKLDRTVGGPFDPNSISDSVDITGKSGHTYSDGVFGQKYGFRITATDANGVEVESFPFNTVYVEDTGPGNKNVVTRGYFDFGVYEFLTSSQFGISPSEVVEGLRATFPAVAPMVNSADTGWYKCLVEGKVIFIPKNFYMNVGASNAITPPSLVNSGLLASDGGSGFNFNACPIVTVGGRQFKFRGIKHWSGDLADVTPQLKNHATVSYAGKTEADLYFALCASTSVGYDPTLEGKPVGALTVPPFVAGDNSIFFGPTTNAGMVLMGSVNWPAAGGKFRLIGTDMKWYSLDLAGYTAKIVPVLELVG